MPFHRPNWTSPPAPLSLRVRYRFLSRAASKQSIIFFWVIGIANLNGREWRVWVSRGLDETVAP